MKTEIYILLAVASFAAVYYESKRGRNGWAIWFAFLAILNIAVACKIL